MIHNGGAFVGSYPKPETLDTWSEVFFFYYGSEKRWIPPPLTRNIIYQSFDYIAHFNGHFYPFCRCGKIVIQTGSAYHLCGKPSNFGENSNGTVHPGGNFPEKSNTFRGITFFPFLPKRPKFSVPFVWITSARLHVERKWKIYRYFVNGTTQSRSCFRCQKKIHYHLTDVFHRNFRTNGKRSGPALF